MEAQSRIGGRKIKKEEIERGKNELWMMFS
jgi:hypothetical protein